MKKIYDVLIIGGGPAGLYASFFAGLRDLSVCLLEAQDELGGKINFYLEKMVWDVGALPPTKGKKVKQHLVNQAKVFNPDIHTGVKIEKLSQNNDLFLAIDDSGHNYYGKSVLIAIGGGVYSPKKIESHVSKKMTKSIYYQFPKQAAIQGKHLVISGGGNSAVDYALEAINYAKKVTLCYRGDELKAHESQVNALKKQGVHVYTNHMIESIEEEPKSAQLVLTLNNRLEKIYGDCLLVQHGYECDASLLETSDFIWEVHDDVFLKCQQPTKTNCSGIFAAGDIHYYEGKINLLSGAFHDATQAINQIKSDLNPSCQKSAMVSSHNEKFDEMNQSLVKEAL